MARVSDPGISRSERWAGAAPRARNHVEENSDRV